MNQTAAELPRRGGRIQGIGPDPIAQRDCETAPRSGIALKHGVQIATHYPGGRLVGSGFVVLGTVVHFHVREDLYSAGRVDTLGMKPVARLAGAAYSRLGEVFELARPK